MKSPDIFRSFYCLRQTPFGSAAIVWSVHEHQPKILRLLLSRPGVSAGQVIKASYSDCISGSSPEIDLAADRILEFLEGGDVRFSLDMVRLDLVSKFQRQVLEAEHGIPRGRVSTYRRIAAHIGRAKAARAVGTALSNNPFPIFIPCHRAIRSDGTLGGFQGGLKMKQSLLEMEGVVFTLSGRAVTKDFFY